MGYSSPLEGERANDCNGSCTSGAVRGQKLRASEVLMLQEKLKQKKFQRWRFLDFSIHCFVAFLNQNEILISKTTCPGDCVAIAPDPALR